MPPIGKDRADQLPHGIEPVAARERITVSSADFDEARLLGCPLAVPVARVQRLFTDAKGRVVYAGWSVYRGDRFVVERELIEDVRRG